MALVGANWGTPADFGKQFAAGCILLAVLVFGVARVVRFNVLGYFLIAAGTALLSGGIKLVAQPDSVYRANGYAVLLMLAALLTWPLIAWQSGPKPDRVHGTI